MNARQRRGVFLMSLAVVAAIGLFGAVFSYVQSVGRKVGPMITLYQFTQDVPRTTTITPAMYKEVAVPEQYAPPAAVRDVDGGSVQVAAEDISSGSFLQKGMIVPPPALKAGQSEIAILINASTGVAGRIQAGDLVDIYASYDAGQAKVATTQVLVANAEVLAIGALQRVDTVGTGGQRFQQNEVVPVTFALERRDVLKVTHAESFATSLRLALVARGTRSKADPNTDVLTSADLLTGGTSGAAVGTRAKTTGGRP